jgi:hypothetical protein
MDNTLSLNLRKYKSSYLIDIIALLAIYLIPTLSHLTGVPFYLFEPMRVFIILALLHSNKQNAYILALTLPLFSFAIASHPYFLKSLIIAIELILNVYLYNLLNQKKMATYLSILFSVIVSKLAYYLLKFILIQSMLIESELVSTPIYIQIITIIIFCIYGFLVLLISKPDQNK